MTVWQDARIGARALTKDVRFTAAVVVTLGLGIGASNMFFTLVDAICLRGLPIEAPERVVLVETRDQTDRPSGLSFVEFQDLLAGSVSLDPIAAYVSAQFSLSDVDRPPERVLGTYASPAMFVILGETPIRGRRFQPSDDVIGANPVALISERLWRSRFGLDPGVVGQVMSINGSATTVIGIMRDGFRYPGNADLWQPLGAMPGLSAQPRTARALSVVGRLAGSASLTQASVDIARMGQYWSAEFPEATQGLHSAIIPINERFNGRISDPVWVTFSVVGMLVLLVACANVANLLLMRAVSRGREVAVRTALGATRVGLVRQFLTESLLLAVPSALLGLGLAQAGITALFSIVPPDSFPYWMQFGVNGRVVIALISLSVGSVVVFGLAPAVHLARGKGLLSGNDRSSTSQPHSRRWTTVFLSIEFALTLVVLAGVALGIRQGQLTSRTEFRIAGDSVLTMWLTLPATRYATPQARTRFVDSLMSTAFGRPEDIDTIASVLPSGGGRVQQLAIGDQAIPSGDAAPIVVTVSVGPRYFEALAIPVLRGRGLTAEDSAPGAEGAVVNQRFVEMFLKQRDPLGQVVRVTTASTGTSSPWARIVGVVPTVRQRTNGPAPDPVVYLPYGLDPPATVALVVRTRDGDPARLTAGIREHVKRLDADLPLYRAMTLDDAINAGRWNGRVSEWMLNTIGGVVFALALVGLYALTAHDVGLRRRELGVRTAVGAAPGDIQRLILRRALGQLVGGITLGVVAIYGFDRFLVSSPERVATMTHPLVLGPLVCAVTVVALVTCMVAARKAAYVNPVAALRAE